MACGEGVAVLFIQQERWRRWGAVLGGAGGSPRARVRPTPRAPTCSAALGTPLPSSPWPSMLHPTRGGATVPDEPTGPLADRRCVT